MKCLIIGLTILLASGCHKGSLFCTIDTPPAPKKNFRFMQKVKITDGFYAGHFGVVKQERSFSDCSEAYLIEVTPEDYSATIVEAVICSVKLL